MGTQATGNRGTSAATITRGRWRAVPQGHALWQVQRWDETWCTWRDRGRPVWRSELPAVFDTQTTRNGNRGAA